MLALHLPYLALRAATRDQPDLWLSPLALGEEERSPRRAKNACLQAVNPTARRQGVCAGMTTARALARCRDLVILARHPENEARLSAELLAVGQSLAPDLEQTRPDTVLLAWQKDEPADLGPLTALPLRQALGPTPDLAHLRVLAGTDFSRAPLALLLENFLPPGPTRRDLTDTLASWGLRSIADFMALPHADLPERIGPEGARLHDLATGRHRRLLTLYRPPQDYRQHLDLDHPLETLDSLLLLLRRFLHTLASRWQAHQRVPDQLLLTLHFEDGQQHYAPLRIPEPTTDSDFLLRLLETHLQGVTAPAPVVALTLDATVTRPSRAQHDLFQKSLRDPNKFAHTLNQLSALLGREALGVPQALDDYRADRFILHPPETLFARRPAPPNPAHGHTCWESALPLRRLRPPRPVQVLSTPQKAPRALLDGPYPGPLREVAGPYPNQSHWWQKDLLVFVHEWDVQLHQGPLGRLTHHPPREWKLEGYY
ncbi:Y-family DNA polymerase [Roseibacillus ishigakijimensis]|uniref:DNA polymerase Y family protein n=1 Tax=Roseibacillus ishigakijimensis TaxID=454146 RepID=A0A934VN53_9BACT|nr:DNA polymerase Y family protein [Roseibacillus ishigakijimensis]MBK1834665.1 DNA polymerase Y family protein [Roseibacillus ishigakijimensis]